MHPESDVDRYKRGDEYEVAGHDPFQPWEAAIEGQTLRKCNTEQNERRRQNLPAKRAEARQDRLKDAVSSEPTLRADAAGTNVRGKAQHQHEQQPRRAIADPNGSHPEA